MRTADRCCRRGQWRLDVRRGISGRRDSVPSSRDPDSHYRKQPAAGGIPVGGEAKHIDTKQDKTCHSERVRGRKRPRAGRYSTWAAPKHDRPSLWAVNQRHFHAAALLRTHQRHITPLNGGIEPAAVLCSRRALPARLRVRCGTARGGPPGSESGVVPRGATCPAPCLVWYRAELCLPGSESGVVPRGAACPAPCLVWYRAELCLPGSEPGVVPRGAACPVQSPVWYRAELCPPGSEPGVVPRGAACPAPSLVWYRAGRPARLRVRCGTTRGGLPGPSTLYS